MRSALLAANRSQRFAACRAARFYSIPAQAASSSKLRGLDASKLSISKTSSPKSLSKPEDLVFGQQFTGMLTITTTMDQR